MCLPGTVEKVRDQSPRLDRRKVLLGAAGAAVAAAVPGAALAGRPAKGRFADLTHVFAEGFPVFVGDEPQRETLVTIPANGFYAQKWTFGEHSGTHMDAPGHFTLGGRLAPQITPQELLVPLAVVDITAKAASNPDAMVTTDDLRAYERRHGRIHDGSFVAMNSGWSSKVGTAAFKGGPLGDYHFPGFSLDAAMWLATERDVTGIGVDTLSLDPGNSTTFPVHVNFLATDRYGMENLNNLDEAPQRGALVYIGLIPWEEGSGGPCRVIANW